MIQFPTVSSFKWLPYFSPIAVHIFIPSLLPYYLNYGKKFMTLGASVIEMGGSNGGVCPRSGFMQRSVDSRIDRANERITEN